MVFCGWSLKNLRPHISLLFATKKRRFLLSEFKADYAGIQPQKGVHMSTSTTRNSPCRRVPRGCFFTSERLARVPARSLTIATRSTSCKLSLPKPTVRIHHARPLVAFFAWLQDEYVCAANGHIQRKPIHLSPKTILNIHVALSVLWTWEVNEGLVEKNIVRTIDAPRVQPPVIETFSKEQIEALLKACDRSARRPSFAISGLAQATEHLV